LGPQKNITVHHTKIAIVKNNTNGRTIMLPGLKAPGSAGKVAESRAQPGGA